MKVRDDYDPRIREMAVDRVDHRHGYTIEFAPSPAQHAQKYECEEDAIRLEIGNDPGLLLCGHADRIHYMGGGLRVCFNCLLKGFGFKTKGESR